MDMDLASSSGASNSDNNDDLSTESQLFFRKVRIIIIIIMYVYRQVDDCHSACLSTVGQAIQLKSTVKVIIFYKKC